MQINSLT